MQPQLVWNKLPALLVHRDPLLQTNFTPLPQDLLIRLSPRAHVAAPGTALRRPHPPHIVGGIQSAQLPLGVAVHEAPDRRQRGPDPPSRLPTLFMVATDTEADLAIDLETTGRS